MASRQLSLVAAVLLVLALAAACGDDASGEVQWSANVSGPVVAHAAKGDGSGDAALIEGVLTVSSGCLLVNGFPVVWPYGTTWDPGAQSVRLSDGQVVALGDRVSGGGGYPSLSALAAAFAEPLADCPMNQYQEVAMFNAGERITVSK